MGSSPSIQKQPLPELPNYPMPVCDANPSTSLRGKNLIECPVCMENKEIVYPSCNHGICKNCVGYMCSNHFNVHNKCPICRKLYSYFELKEYSKYCLESYDNNVADKLEKQIQKLMSRDPSWIAPIKIASRQLSNDELHTQISAINDMFDGKMSYTEMRMLAG